MSESAEIADTAEEMASQKGRSIWYLSGVGGSRVYKINSAAPHNPSGLWALRSGQGSWLQGRGLSLSLSTSSTFSTEQFALIEGFRCDVINITVNPLLVFNPEGQALLSGAQTPQHFGSDATVK